MRVLDRYLIRGFLGPFTFSVTLILVMFIVVDVFNRLDEILKSSAGASVILTYYANLVPVVLVQVIPIAVLVSVLYLFGHLNRHNEIIAMRASGVSAFGLLAPFLFIGLLVSFGVFLLSETIVPRATVVSTSIKEGLLEKGRGDLRDRAIHNVALYAAGNRMVFAREFTIQTNMLHDVVVLEDDHNRTLRSKLTARRAVWRDGDWIAQDVVEHRLDQSGEVIGEPIVVPERPLGLDRHPDDFIREASQVEFMNTRELKVYIDNLKGASDRIVQRLSVDFHYKIAFPFVSFVVIMIGAPLALRTERGSAIVGVGTSFVVVLLYYGCLSLSLALGKGGHLPPILAAWLSNLAFASVGLYLIRKVS
ncbi:MAG: hypothetical protein MOGMAGMI_00439 [Candidatus Omnitrophica bacterium]|nr:hypothetical protein [Candidatus Omnitrophota bacterium]